MQPTMHGPFVPEDMQRRARRNKWIAPASAGLAIGAVMGLAAGLGLAVAPANAGALNEEVILAAVDTCSMDEAGYTILDQGQAVQLDTEGTDFLDSGTDDYAAYVCMLIELGVPESTQRKIARTRALDGTQADSWDGVKASWSYHPDTGANVLMENEDSK